MPVFYLTASLFFGKKAGNNPWRATGLEWMTTSPPDPHNFPTTPTVYFGPYEYGVPDGLSLVDKMTATDNTTPRPQNGAVVMEGGPHGR
jgi:heme/copper-type cytochrome/quinol oxidase subunit 1